MINERKAGILLHITSLKGKYGIGTLGQEAYDFVDFLAEAKLKLWQILPLYPTGYGDSPYQAFASKALNYYLIDLDELVKEGLLKEDFILQFNLDSKRVDFSKQFKYKMLCLKEAFMNYSAEQDFLNFIDSKEYHEFALFMTLKQMFDNNPWYNWPKEYQNYTLELEEKVLKYNEGVYKFYLWTQYVFLKQWRKLKEYTNKKGIEIIGDMPLYLAYDSADVYFHPERFYLNKNKRMVKVAGCPPDAFSTDGQLWGNPLYLFNEMKKDGYAWWKERINDSLDLVDYLRIDHFRGFDRYYAIPASDNTARNGKWVSGPKFDLFKDLVDKNIIAEDLGVIDEGVIKLLNKTKFPGMKVLEFAFDGNELNPHKPRNYSKNAICYTGTHDNMPLKGYLSSMNTGEYNYFIDNLERELKLFKLKLKSREFDEVINILIELAFKSDANFTIIPIQDLLHLGNEARMNFPSTLSNDNWSFMLDKKDLKGVLATKLTKLVLKYNR